MKNQKSKLGFTLLEVIVVVIIVGVIAALALPRFLVTSEIARNSEGVQILSAIRIAQENYRYENESLSYTALVVDLDIEIPPLNNFDPPVALIPGLYVAMVRRNTAEYLLTITVEGDIGCINLIGTPCEELGY